MEPHETPAQRSQLLRQQAPVSLNDGIINRLEQRKTYLSAQKPLAELLEDLHHPRWEVRALAVQALGTSGEPVPLSALETALQDEQRFVRIAATGALEHSDRPVPRDLLLTVLRDHDWQVREVAILALAKNTFPLPEKEAVLFLALEDVNAEVRDAAAFVLKQAGHVLQQPLHDGSIRYEAGLQETSQERTYTSMTMISLSDSSTHEEETLHQSTTLQAVTDSAPKRRRLRWNLRYMLVAAALLALVITVTAATLSWWDPFYGKPDLYQAVGQSQTQHGAKITVTRAYADLGRTIVAYDISYTDHARELFVGTSNLFSQYAQVPGALSGTPCSAPDSDGVTHCYFTTQAFQVPANVNTLTLTWDVTRLLVVESGVKTQSNATIDGQWHFVFTVPFHHTSDALPGPPPDGHIYH